jgi:hypothetical protein
MFGFNQDSVPNLVLFFPGKGVYATMIGTFDEDNLERYIDNVLNGKVSLGKIESSQIVLNNLKCEEIREEKEPEEDDEILREIIAEETKKRAEFEKERGDTKNKGKKRRKSPKMDSRMDL